MEYFTISTGAGFLTSTVSQPNCFWFQKAFQCNLDDLDDLDVHDDDDDDALS